MALDKNLAGVTSADTPNNEMESKGPPSHQSTDSIVVLFFEILSPETVDSESCKRHKEVALSIVSEFGGRSSGGTENSLRAYFANAKEALKGAVKIQQYMSSENQNGSGDGAGQGRIGIHFADTLSEGSGVSDVIGMSTRLARGAGPSQIFVSQTVHDAAADLQGVHFEPVNVVHKALVWDGPPVYSVTWEKAVDYKPGTCLVLYFRPVRGGADSSFPALWTTVVREEGAAWGGGIAKKQVLADNGLSLVADDGKSALNAAHNLLRFVWDRVEKDPEKPVIPVHAFIHLYDRAGEGVPTIKDSDFPSAAVSPGEVYVSTDALKFIRNQSHVIVASGKEASAIPSWHKIIMSLEQDGEEDVEFKHREELGAGTAVPCFYCGSRRHRPGECPSKHLPDNTLGLERLGHLSVKDMNGLFQKFISVENNDPHKFLKDVLEGRGNHLSHAFHAFYDLNRVLQLRFFRTLFYAPGNEWGKKVDSGSQSKGGQQWLALDSLRVSEVVRAEALLKEAQARHPEDYRIYCTLGYVYIERDDPAEAEYFLKKALKYTKANTSKIFVHFLLARINRLLGRMETAHRNITDIIALDPGCQEALYEDTFFRFAQGDEKGAIQRLSVLIAEDRKYYVQALIDPQMTPFQGPINEHLKEYYVKAKEEAEGLVRTVDEQLEQSTALLRGKDLQEVRGLRAEIQSLLASRSYFGYLDIINLGNSVVKVCNDVVQEQKRESEALLQNLDQQADKDMNFVLDYSFPRLINSYYKKLEQIKVKIRSAMEAPPPASPEELEACVLVREELRAELARIETEFKRFEGLRQILFNGFKFVRNSIVLLTAVLVFSIFVLPLALDGFNQALMGLDLPYINDVGMFQRSFTFLAGASSLIVSFLFTTRGMFGAKAAKKPVRGKKPVKTVKQVKKATGVKGAAGTKRPVTAKR